MGLDGVDLGLVGDGELLLERGNFRTIAELARDTVPIFSSRFDAPTLSLDAPYQEVLRDFHAVKRALTNATLRESFRHVFGEPRIMQ